MGIREDLHANDDDYDDDEAKDMESRRKGKKAKKIRNDCPPACFTLSQEEIEQFFTCIIGVKLPYGYARKISRYLDSAKQKFSGMKSHDCHVLMTQILLVAILGSWTSMSVKHYLAYATFSTSSLRSRLA